MEVPAILTLVGGCFRGQARSPKRAFDIGEARRVWAILRRIHRGIPLEIDVEGGAERDSVATRRALRNIISVESIETHVAVGVG